MQPQAGLFWASQGLFHPHPHPSEAPGALLPALRDSPRARAIAKLAPVTRRSLKK